MAYAFNKVEDYFRRGKTGQMGSLQKGTEGAPPPTAAAQNLAKTAETSAEQGNATTNAYRAARGSNTAAMQSALAKPTEQKAQNWGEQQQAEVNKFLEGGKAQIESTYKAPEDLQQKITQAAAGEAPAAGELQQALKPTEMSFQPYQVQMPALEGQQQLAGGVGGIQAALQKGRGGRYTQGMAALDASLLAGNREAMQGVQQKLGDIYQGTREKKAQFEKADETLAEQARQKGAETQALVKGQLEARLPELLAAQSATAQQEAEAQAERERAGVTPQVNEYLRNQLLAQGLSEADIGRMGSEEFLGQYSRFNPQMGLTQQFLPEDLSSYVTRSGPMASYTSSTIDPRYAQIAGLLGINPVQSAVQYQQYGVDQAGINQLAQNLAGQYRGVGQMVANEQAAAAEAEALRQTQEWAAKQPGTTVDEQGNTTTAAGGIPISGPSATNQEMAYSTFVEQPITLGGILPTPKAAVQNVGNWAKKAFRL